MSTPTNKHLTSEGRDGRFKKTQLCMFFQEGRCRFGSSCAFAHNASEVEVTPDLAKTAMCKLWKTGTCKLSADCCRFAHGKQDLRTKPPSSKEQRVSLNVHQLEPKMELESLQAGRVQDQGSIAEPRKVKGPSAAPVQIAEPLNVVAPAQTSLEPMYVTSSLFGIHSPPARSSPAKSIGFSPWDHWDNDTAVGDISSEDDGSSSWQFDSEETVDLSPGTDPKTPPGLDEPVVVDFVQRMMGFGIKAPPGLEVSA